MAAGVVAGIIFGLMIQLVMGRMVAIGALYTLGEPSLTVGWMAHIVHSTLFGLVLWFVNIGFLWPAWLNYVSCGSGLPIPFFPVQPLVGHLVYGAATGGLFELFSK